MTDQVITETQEEVTKVEDRLPTKVVKTTTRVVPPQITDESPHKVYQTKKVIFRTYQALWYILGIIETLLGFRLFLKFVGANPGSGFAGFIYSLSGLFTNPFIGVVNPSISGSSVLEWSTLIAIAVYAILVWLIIEFFQLVKPVKQEEIEQTVDSV